MDKQIGHLYSYKDRTGLFLFTELDKASKARAKFFNLETGDYVFHYWAYMDKAATPISEIERNIFKRLFT
jgi:hypothetical protein